MLDTNAQGIYAFFKMLYSGALVGLCYDLAVNVLFFRRTDKSGADMLFASASFVILTASLFAAARLKLRMYLFMGIAAGWGVYFAFVSSLVMNVFDYICSAIRNLFKPFVNYSNKFVIKHKNSIAKVNFIYRKAKSIPNRIKKSYNKYAECIFKGRKHSD